MNAAIGYGYSNSINNFSSGYQSGGIAARGGFNIGYKF